MFSHLSTCKIKTTRIIYIDFRDYTKENIQCLRGIAIILVFFIRDVGGAVKWRTAPHRNFCPLTPHRTAPQKFLKIAHCTAPHRRNF